MMAIKTEAARGNENVPSDQYKELRPRPPNSCVHDLQGEGHGFKAHSGK